MMTENSDISPNGGLTQGDNSGYKTCEICNSLTRNSPINLRISPGDASGAGTAVELRACDTCRMNLANVAWEDYING